MKALRGPAVVIVLILAFALVWLVSDTVAGPNPVRDGFSSIASPVQYALSRLLSPLRGVTDAVRGWTVRATEYEELRQENAELRRQIMLLHEAQIENETLREQLGFKTAAPTFRLLAAEVIGRDPNNLLDYLIIDRGRADGLRAGMPVLTGQGLVGRVSEVSANSAKIMLVTDVSSSVAVIVQRSRATGVVQGYPGHGLIMRYIPQDASIEVGDVVLTSGLGGNLPRRLVIGQIAEIRKTDLAMFQEARLVPAVDTQRLESVMVLMNFEPTEVDEEMQAEEGAPE